MKTLAPITIGEYTVTVTVQDAGRTALLFTATCGQIKETGKLNCQGPHDHSADQFQKDVTTFAQKLAAQVAGHENSRKLKQNLLAG